MDVLNELFSSGIVSIFGDIFTLTGIIIAMLILDWRMALVTMMVLPLIAVATAVFRRRARDSYRRVRIAIAKINAFLNEHITGMSVVQLYNRERAPLDFPRSMKSTGRPTWIPFWRIPGSIRSSNC